MNNDEYLAQLTIPLPCPQEWRRMRGGERARHCDVCNKTVHNLAAMTSDEVVALVKENDGELCGRVTRQSDGALVTSERRVRPPRRSALWQFNIRSMMSTIAWIAAACGLFRLLDSATVTAGRMRIRSGPACSSMQSEDLDPDEDSGLEGVRDETMPVDPVPSSAELHR